MPALVTAALLAFTQSGPAPVQFEPSRGWHVGATSARHCTGVPAGRCTEAHSWASTVPLEDCPGCLPHKTLAGLPPGGIVIQVTRTIERPLVARQTLVWPPTIGSSQVVAGFEGLPARIGVYQRFARVGKTEIWMFVFFGRAHPSAAQLKLANGKLRSARMT
jgi:hypothetical protein